MAHRILVVDDDPQIRKAFVQLLHDEAYEVTGCADAAEALVLLAKQETAVMVADLGLPEMDGLELLEQVRKQQPTCQRVLLTGQADLGMLQSGINAGTIKYFVSKPWDNDELLTTLDHAVARYLQVERQSTMAELVGKQNQELESMSRQLVTMVDRRTSQIERAKKEWERTFDAISSPLTQVNDRFELLRANIATARHAGIPIRQLPGTLCYRAIFGREDPCPGCPLLERDSWREVGNGEATVVDDRSGKTFLLSTYVFDRDSEQPRYICNYKDVTEEKKLQRQVMQSEKMAGIGQLAGGVAHELNNPIGVILSFTQFSQQIAAELKDEELVDNLQEIESAARRCKEIVAGLLDFSRPSTDERMGLINLSETLEKAHFLVSTQKAAKAQEVVKQYGEDVPLVLGNHNQLLQVFINLVRNAVQAMPEGGGTLYLTTGADDRGQAFAEVSDTGVGIVPADLNRLFEPFYTTKEPGQGTGLGLSVTYGIVERHGGRIDVSSEPGQGASFRVLLPPAPGDDEE